MRRRREPQVTEPALDPDLRLRLQRLVRPKWYAERHPSTGDALVDPVEDFLSRGCFESDDPTPLFDGEWYCSVYGLHGLADPVLHYLQSGAARGFDPSPAFDARWYMRACGALPPDVPP